MGGTFFCADCDEVIDTKEVDDWTVEDEDWLCGECYRLRRAHTFVHKFYCKECDHLIYAEHKGLAKPCMECGERMVHLGQIKVDPDKIAEQMLKDHLAKLH